MDVQWPLVLFTVLNGIGGWLIAFTAVNEFTHKSKNDKVRMVALVLGIVLVVVAGICSAFHLSHPERMMNALSHPTSGIFTEALLTGLIAVATVVYIVLVRRGASETAIKTMAVIAGVLGVVLPVATGCSYLMPGRPEWNTPLFPLACAGSTGVTGAAAYLMLLSVYKDEKPAVETAAKATMWFGVAAVVLPIAWACSNGTAMGAQALLFWVCVVLVGGVVPAVCGAMVGKDTTKGGLAVCAFVTSVVGSFAFRCFMWLVGAGVLDLIGNGNWFGQI